MEKFNGRTNPRCGPDFPITPLPDLPGRCQNQRKPENIENKEYRAAVHPGKGYVKRIGLHQR